MLKKFSLQQYIRIGFSAALILLLFISILSVTSIYKIYENWDMVNHTHEVLINLEEVMSLMKDGETAVRGFALTKNDIFLAPYFYCLDNMNESFKKLEELMKNKPIQKKKLIITKKLCLERLGILKTVMNYAYQNDQIKAEQIIREGKGKVLMDRIRSNIREIKLNQTHLLLTQKKDTKVSQVLIYVIIGVGNLLAIAIALVSMININSELLQRYEAENKLKEKQKTLEEVNKELEAFSYTISHDLRSPLRAIDGFSRILEEDYQSKLDEEGLRVLKIIKGNASKMGKLIDDLLEFSRVSKKTPTEIIVDMESLVEEVLMEVKLDYTHLQTEITIHPLPPALGDKTLLHQVWINLISNAFKYSSKKNPAQIEIGFEKNEPLGFYYIKDNGTGFDTQYKGKLFGVFQRLHSTKDFEGNGVGLAIVQRIVDRHGGKVVAEGKLNEGAIFKFSIPLAEISLKN